MLNPQTGLPYSFLEMPRQLHVQFWSDAAEMGPPTGTLRCARQFHSMAPDSTSVTMEPENLPENTRAVQHYLEQECAFQKDLLASLRSHLYTISYMPLTRLWRAIGSLLGFGMNSPLPSALVEHHRNPGKWSLLPQVQQH